MGGFFVGFIDLWSCDRLKKAEQECYIEVENLDSPTTPPPPQPPAPTTTGCDYYDYCKKGGTRGLARNQSLGLSPGGGGSSSGHYNYHVQQQPPPPASSSSSQQLLNIYTYTGILYTQTEKRYIQFKLKDFYSNNNSILLTGKIPGSSNFCIFTSKFMGIIVFLREMFFREIDLFFFLPSKSQNTKL